MRPEDLDADGLRALEYIESALGPVDLDPEALIRRHRVMTPAWVPLLGVPPSIAVTWDGRFAGGAGDLPYRGYRPTADRGELLPVIAYFHGGGFVTGSIDHADVACRALANASGCVVLSFAYRLAPEHPFPAAVEDAIAALRWVVAEATALAIDPARLALGGESAGGSIAAAAALASASGDAPRIAHQLLICPVLSHGHRGPSYERYGAGYGLSTEELDACWARYLADSQDPRHPWASPLQAADLTGLAPATIVVAECDVLRDEAVAYAQRLIAEGISADVLLYRGVFHGFFSYAGFVRRAALAMHDAGVSLRRALFQPAGERLGAFSPETLDGVLGLGHRRASSERGANDAQSPTIPS